MTDLISEANETVTAMAQAQEGVEDAIRAANTAGVPQPPAPEGDFFDFGAAPAALPTEAPAIASVPSQDSGPASVFDQAQAPAPAPEQSFGQPIPVPEPSYSQAPAPPPGPSVVPSPDIPRPHAARNASAVSVGFDQDMIMGAGGSVTGPPVPAPAPAAVTNGLPTMGQVNELKSKAREAQDVAQDAEESRRALSAQLDELRRVADEAEDQARKHATGKDTDKKKRGRFSRGGSKKTDAKEAARLATEAKSKKDQCLAVQAQVKDADILAQQTKQEADRLRQEAEEAEMRIASAASMQQQAPAPASNGHAEKSFASAGFGAPPPSAGMGQAPPNTMAPMMGQAPPAMGQAQPYYAMAPAPYSGAFDNGVMGGGNGVSIPTPAAQDSQDPWGNPFG